MQATNATPNWRNMKIVITESELAALKLVLEHFLTDEERDYNETPEEKRSGHIFDSLRRLEQLYIEATYDGPC
jgi:hypothetical protein